MSRPYNSNERENRTMQKNITQDLYDEPQAAGSCGYGHAYRYL